MAESAPKARGPAQTAKRSREAILDAPLNSPPTKIRRIVAETAGRDTGIRPFGSELRNAAQTE